jgi:hypothetical protein
MPGCMLFAKFLREAESGEGGRPDGHESVANACMRVQRYIQFGVCLRAEFARSLPKDQK